MDKSQLISRRQAALILNVSFPFVEKLLTRNNIKPHQIPGHNRSWYLRAEVEQLASMFNRAEFPENGL
jgi:hypothetical protein